MNYYITRAWKWKDPQGPDIKIEEWRVVVAGNPELSFEGDDWRYVRWQCATAEDSGSLEWTPDGIIAHEPGRAFLRKIMFIAEDLQAKVFDEHGGYYVAYDR